jgi:hypothetical protein
MECSWMSVIEEDYWLWFKIVCFDWNSFIIFITSFTKKVFMDKLKIVEYSLFSVVVLAGTYGIAKTGERLRIQRQLDCYTRVLELKAQEDSQGSNLKSDFNLGMFRVTDVEDIVNGSSTYWCEVLDGTKK